MSLAGTCTQGQCVSEANICWSREERHEETSSYRVQIHWEKVPDFVFLEPLEIKIVSFSEIWETVGG